MRTFRRLGRVHGWQYTRREEETVAEDEESEGETDYERKEKKERERKKPY